MRNAVDIFCLQQYCDIAAYLNRCAKIAPCVRQREQIEALRQETLGRIAALARAVGCGLTMETLP